MPNNSLRPWTVRCKGFFRRCATGIFLQKTHDRTNSVMRFLVSFQISLSGNSPNDEVVSICQPCPFLWLSLAACESVRHWRPAGALGPASRAYGNIQQQQNPPRKRLRIGDDAVSKNACKGIRCDNPARQRYDSCDTGIDHIANPFQIPARGSREAIDHIKAGQPLEESTPDFHCFGPSAEQRNQRPPTGTTSTVINTDTTAISTVPTI